MPSSISSGATTSYSACGGAILEAIGQNDGPAIRQLLDSLATAPAFPLSKATLLFAAVKLGRRAIAAQLLQAGAPPHFLVGELPPADRGALLGAGISADGVEHLSPLAIAVLQQNLGVASLLLESGASAGMLVGGRPLLLHYHDAATCKASPPAPSPPPPQVLDLGSVGRSDSLTLSGATGGVYDTEGGSQHGTGSSSISSDMEAVVQEMEERLRLLWVLLQHGADPLQQSLDGRHSFFKVCHQPAMLRLAVNYVRHQCEAGRRLSEAEAQQLVMAAARAFLSGF